MDLPSDPQQAPELSNGGGSSFESLYQDAAPALYSWAHLTIGPGLKALVDPQDLVQEATVRAFRRFEEFDRDRGTFRSWLFRIAKNYRNEVLRKITTSGRVEPKTDGLRVSQCPESVTSIGLRVSRDDSLALVIEEIQRFDEHDRDLFIRCGLMGETCAKAASRMGAGLSATQKRWASLRKRLQDRPVVRELLGLYS